MQAITHKKMLNRLEKSYKTNLSLDCIFFVYKYDMLGTEKSTITVKSLPKNDAEKYFSNIKLQVNTKKRMVSAFK